MSDFPLFRRYSQPPEKSTDNPAFHKRTAGVARHSQNPNAEKTLPHSVREVKGAGIAAIPAPPKASRVLRCRYFSISARAAKTS